MSSIIFMFLLVPFVAFLLIGLNLLLDNNDAFAVLLALPITISDDISIHSLPVNKVCVFNQDKNKLVYVFENEADAAKFLTPNRVAQFSDDQLKQNKNLQHIRRVINKNILTSTEKGKFFIYKNPGYSSNLSLVVWGQNFTSQVGSARFSPQISNMIKLAPYQYSVCIGLILSDAWVEFAESYSKSARLGLKQSMGHCGYLMFVFNLLSHYCGNYPYVIKINLNGKLFYGLEFKTRALPCFIELRNMFYPEGFKIIPKDIYNKLTPIALAHMIMGDGGVQKHGGLTIHTNAFSIQDAVTLVNVLIIRYGLSCSIYLKQRNKTEPVIYISERSMSLLRSIVAPYFHYSMLYKLGLSSPVKPNHSIVQAGISPMVLFMFLVPIIALLLIGLNVCLAPHKPYKEKQSEFECGFHSFLGQNRSQFSISFFLFGLLFLIFDLEIVLIYPYVVSAYSNSNYGLTVVFIFLLILTAGFVFEIGKKALTINSKQSNNLNNISTDSIQSISLSNISLKSSKRNYQTKILSNQINRQIRSLSTTRVVQQDNSQH